MTAKEQITSRESQMVTIEQRKMNALDSIQELEAERRKLIVPARAGNNQAAQQRLAQIDEQIAASRRDIADDEKAIAEINAELEPLRIQLAIEEHKRKRAALCKRVSEAANRAQANQAKFEEFTRGVTESIDDGASIGAELNKLDAEARELGLAPLPSITQVNGLRANVLGVMVKAHPSLPGTDVPKQLDYFVSQLAAVASKLQEREERISK